MGAWGVKIYQDDVACDVKEEYVEALKKGISNEEITEKLIEEYTSYEDEEEEAIFWIALSDIQWKYGRLKEEVKVNALRVIESGIDLRKWEEDSKLLEKRKQVLLELKEKLNNPQPPEKKVKGYGASYKCEWKIGDVFAYPLKSEEAKSLGFEGQYLIIIKTGETGWYPEHIIPVVKVKITKNGKIPETIEEINELEFIQSSVYTYYDNFSVNFEEFSLPKDEYGITPIYNILLLVKSKRVIPKQLIFIGNFDGLIKFPRINLPLEIKGNGVTISFCKNLTWKELEQLLLESYRRYNLKQAEIYQPDYWQERGINREEKDKKIEEFFKKRGLL